MKKQILSALVIGIIALFSYTAANAQLNSPINVSIPFDFYVGDKKMTAGTYTIGRLSPLTSQTALLLRRVDGKAQAVMFAVPMKASRKSDVSLLFNRYDTEYYLSEIRNQFAEFGVRLPQGKTEINLARQYVKPKEETVTLTSTRKEKTGKAKVTTN